ncbi:conjugal transfer protein TraH [Burkholderia vietnamiensis]|uniref:conjugal transfer protein TraH n=1 Tax=Burkholderia vietnamiensis TaxID=60552 RepID=UPI0009B93A12|nr:conjugal transfer protein TraH [Burkholderia vietnamiensis]MBR8189155.1 conjugal transfer protein TraH [Burkholderia vietnamiensis]HDR9174362.1 conjugal transfer protein TraH [Burkholderia vietnamiensis]
MMPFFRRRTISVVVAAVTIWSLEVTPAYAFLQQFYDTLGSNAQVSPPAAIKGGGMNYYSTGGGSMRFGNAGVTPFSITLPQLNAGCGGIDLVAGAFGFLSRAQLEAFLRNVVQNAGAVAFSIALETVAAPIKQAMTEWADKIQQLNQFFQNSCRLAKGIVSSSSPERQWMSDLSSKVIETFSGLSDGSNSNSTSQGSLGGDAQQAAAADIDTAQNSVGTTTPAMVNGQPLFESGRRYNLLWEALKTVDQFSFFSGISLSSDPIGDYVNANQDQWKEILLSVYGTYITGVVSDAQKNQDGISNGSSGVSKPKTGNIRLNPMVDFKQLIGDAVPVSSATNLSLNVYSCGANSDCIPSTDDGTDLPTTTINFGFPALAPQVYADMEVIANAIKNRTSQLSDSSALQAAQRLQGASGLPVVKVIAMMSTQPNFDAGFGDAMLQSYSRVIATKIAMELVYAMGKQIQGALARAGVSADTMVADGIRDYNLQILQVMDNAFKVSTNVKEQFDLSVYSMESMQHIQNAQMQKVSHALAESLAFNR